MLHALKLGSGKPLVILHGFLGMADNWKTLGKTWSENGYEVHLLDQRNHGRSFHSNDFSYELMAQDVKEYCDHYDLNSIFLLGHSMGGKVAMTIADQYPELVKKLVVADIAPKTYAPHHSDIIKALKSVDFNKVKRRNDADEMMVALIPDAGTRQFLLKSLFRKEKTTFGWRFNLDVLENSQHMIGDHKEFNNRIMTDTLFVRGGDSVYVLDSDRVSIDYAFAKAQLKTIPNAGHWLHAQQPQLFYETVTEFLDN